MNQVYIKTKVVSGEDSLKRLEKFEDKTIWLIADAFLVDNGSLKQITDHLDPSNKVVVCGDVVPDPPLEVIAKGVALIHSVRPDVIIAYGGGSAIDTAKGVIYFSRLGKYEGNLRFIAIPTTSGTGSEVTSVTVISDKQTQVKYPVVDDNILPDEVILCPTLTVSVPPAVTANTGMDVLTHAIEAYVSTNANTYSDALAEKAVELVFRYLKVCYHEGTHLKARSMMQEASNLAGSAFNIAGLGMNHSIAHQLGSVFHLPHGLANAVILNAVIKKNSETSEMKHRYAILARKLNLASLEMSDEDAVGMLCSEITKCQKEMAMPLTLRECNVTEQDLRDKIDIIYQNAMNDRCTETAKYIFSKTEIVNVLFGLL
ncbi:MAG: iron-containing alcohol dehydrogenase [Eubacterium sp.]|nr:iron-containing alcohol dehydrogenase [Eubacterium sp.]